MDVQPCPRCQQPASGRFCSSCGTALGGQSPQTVLPAQGASRSPYFIASTEPTSLFGRVVSRFGKVPLILTAAIVLLVIAPVGVFAIGKVAAKAAAQPLAQRLNHNSEKHTISGTLSVVGKPDGSSCHAGTAVLSYNGYDDIRPGALVTVTDETSKVIATGQLDTPTYKALGENDPFGIGSCVFPFTVDVPKASFYSVEVTHRGKLTYSHDEMVSRNWTVASEIG